jgi:hypothetical protein
MPCRLINPLKTYNLFNFENPVRQARRDSLQVSLRILGQTQRISRDAFQIKCSVWTAMTQKSQLKLDAGFSESLPLSLSDSAAQPCQTLTLDIRNLHKGCLRKRAAASMAPGRPSTGLAFSVFTVEPVANRVKRVCREQSLVVM